MAWQSYFDISDGRGLYSALVCLSLFDVCELNSSGALILGSLFARAIPFSFDAALYFRRQNHHLQHMYITRPNKYRE